EDVVEEGETACGFHAAKYDDGELWFIASDDGTQTIVRSYNPTTKVKADIITGLPRHTYCQFLDHLNEVYMAGMSDSTGERISIHNIRYDGTNTTVSTTRNLFNAPKARFIGENSGKLYA